jgi:hypothetical protein
VNLAEAMAVAGVTVLAMGVPRMVVTGMIIVVMAFMVMIMIIVVVAAMAGRRSQASPLL